MKKRFKFACWNCKRNYTLQREITVEQVLTVACPYCDKEAVVDLKPYHTEKKVVMRGDESDAHDLGEELQLPNVLPTQQPESDD